MAILKDGVDGSIQLALMTLTIILTPTVLLPSADREDFIIRPEGKFFCSLQKLRNLVKNIFFDLRKCS